MPVHVGKRYCWNSNGTITSRIDPSHRMVFFECEHLDNLFGGIEEIIGVSIQRHVVESKSRSVIEFIKKHRRWPRGALARPLADYMTRSLIDAAKTNGYGVIEVKDLQWRKGYLRCEVSNPYSLPMMCGDIRGSFEAILNKTNAIEYEQVGADRYSVTCYQAPHAPELAGRLLPETVRAKPGDYEYSRCEECGVPLEISKVRWDFERGTITNDDLQVRVALYGVRAVLGVFDELEVELGSEVTDAIIEAQKRYSLSLLNDRIRQVQRGDLELAMAVTGMGRLASAEISPGLYSTRVENPAVPLITVGSALALYEFLTRTPGKSKWEISDDGDLLAEFYPA